jgi:hypothetical protein
MTRRSVRLAVVCAGLGTACLLAGCGPTPVRGVKLKGQVVVDGKPLKPLPGERVWVTFERVGSWAGNPVIMTSATMQKDGTFVLEGQEKNGTPPGQYAVTLHGEFSSAEGENRFAGLFPEGKSPFVIDVTDAENQSFVIDLSRKTIAKE